MGPCLFLTILFASGIYAEHVAEQVLDRGPVHEMLSGYMARKQHLRKVTAMDPVHFACKWHMSLWCLGDYGRHFSTLILTPGNCSTKDLMLNDTFPCVLIKGASHTTCQGPIPNMENVSWRVEDLGESKPTPWTLTIPEAPRVLYGNPKPFEAQLTYPHLIGLALARGVQHSGTYLGETLVICRRTKYAFHISVDNALVRSSLIVYAKGAPRNHVVRVMVSWEASVDTSGALVLSTDGGKNLTRYTRHDLSRPGITFHGVKHSVYSHFESGEPRLCALTTMITACLLMDGISTDDRQTLGDVVGFNAYNMLVTKDRKKDYKVVIEGAMLGTRGVLEGIYAASALDYSEVAWTELPLSHLDRCAPRVYLHKDCLPRVPGMRFIHKNVAHYSFL